MKLPGAGCDKAAAAATHSPSPDPGRAFCFVALGLGLVTPAAGGRHNPRAHVPACYSRRGRETQPGPLSGSKQIPRPRN